MSKDYGPAPMTKKEIARMAVERMNESLKGIGAEVSITFNEEDSSLNAVTHPIKGDQR